ncbi:MULTISPECIES: hypothetical protein [Acinetobacter]|uniref:hypothetical protein n=1 Tax=Acinetobacter TaxID=469 RepID=UPI0030199AB3
MEKYFKTSLTDFFINYIFTSPWVIGGLIVIGLFTLASATSTYIENKNKKSKANDDFIFDSVIGNVVGGLIFLIIVLILILGYWVREVDESDQAAMRKQLLEMSYENAILKLDALHAYEKYNQDKKIQVWEYQAFKDGLVKLQNEDVQDRVRFSIFYEVADPQRKTQYLKED